MKHFLLSVLLLTFCLAVSAQIDLYVSQTSGNDTNAGTSDDAAFATLGAAVAASSNNVTNPDNDNVIINISGGVYTETDLNIVQNTQIVFWDESGAPTIVTFQGDDASKDTVFFVSNTFVVNGDNGDEEIVFRFNNLKTAINFNNSNATAVYTLSVLYTFFDYVNQGIESVNANQLLLQQSVFNSSYTAEPVVAQGPGLGTDSNFEIDRTDFINIVGSVHAFGYDEGTLKEITWVGGTKGAFLLADGSWEVSNLNVTGSAVGGVTNGAGIDFTGGQIEITDSSFTDCQATQGGAVYLENADASLTQVTFTNCLSIESGGAYAHNGSFNTTSSLQDVTFQSNNATKYGGGIELYGAFLGLSLYNVAFNNNTAGINGSLIDCCGAALLTGAACTPATVSITDDSVSSLGNIGGTNITCPVEDVDDFSTVVSVSNDSVNSNPNDDDGANLTWLWVILALLAVAVIIAIAAGAGYFVYRKRKMGQYAAVD